MTSTSGTGAPSLRDRLRLALNQPAREGPVAVAAAVTELRDLSRLGGRWFQSERGPGYVIESNYELGHEHGRIPLHRALGLDTAALGRQCKDDRFAVISAKDFLYIDTETTGLGGAGAMVFLAGIARFDGSVLRLRQFLLPSPDYEGGLLGGLGDELAAAKALVSYNGKSFDMPMLESRYILSRQRPEFRALPHLDLLHPNRRLFKGTFDSHRLTRMEQELLGFEREDDCPSAQVPALYFQFQRSGDPTPIQPVLRHNAWDILSLVALAAHLAMICDGNESAFRAARAAEYAGDFARAADYYRDAIAGPLNRSDLQESVEGLARSCAKLGRWDEAADHWQTLIDEPRSRRVTPYVELAKIAEHHLADPARAYVAISTALSMLEKGLLRPGTAASESGRDALVRRIERIERRLRA